MSHWLSRSCVPCKGGMTPLTPEVARDYLVSMSGWSERDGVIEKTYSFKNYYETVAFVNAVAWIAHREDHHPDMVFGYKTCTVRYTTHAANGLTDNDFICATKADALFGANQRGES